MTTEPNTVSVVVPTLDRPFRTAAVVRAILAGDELPLEILVVDQSEDDSTKRALDLIGDERIRHVPLRPPSTSAARNEGARLARGGTVLGALRLTEQRHQRRAEDHEQDDDPDGPPRDELEGLDAF